MEGQVLGSMLVSCLCSLAQAEADVEHASLCSGLGWDMGSDWQGKDRKGGTRQVREGRRQRRSKGREEEVM